MIKQIRRYGLIVVGVALGTLAACESSAPRDANPGALPHQRTSNTPQITSATYIAHGELLERRGEFERAVAQYRQALELTPDSLEARNRLGVTLNKLGQHAEASKEFRHTVALHPNLAYLFNNLGFSLYLESRYAEAEPAFARALQLQPSFRRARMNHGLVLAKLGQFDESFVEFAQACSQADAYYNVAILQSEAGRYADAAHSLERALSAQPDFAAARDQLREISRLAAAEEATRQAELAAAQAAAEAERVEAERAAQVASAALPDSAAPVVDCGDATEPTAVVVETPIREEVPELTTVADETVVTAQAEVAAVAEETATVAEVNANEAGVGEAVAEETYENGTEMALTAPAAEEVAPVARLVAESSEPDPAPVLPPEPAHDEAPVWAVAPEAPRPLTPKQTARLARIYGEIDCRINGAGDSAGSDRTAAGRIGIEPGYWVEVFDALVQTMREDETLAESRARMMEALLGLPHED